MFGDPVILPPVAPRRPEPRLKHGDVVEDPYAWMRDYRSAEAMDYLAAENAYAEARTAHLEPLRGAIFGEIRSRVQETDMAVPVADGPWWYYTRTIDGGAHPIHARAPRRPGDLRPNLDAAPIDGEQVLLDANALAEGHEFFALGGLTVSPDHRYLAYAVDLVGDERFSLTVVDLDCGTVLDQSLEGLGYGLEFSADGRQVFVVRVDEAWRPFQVWRHEVGSDPADDALVLAEPDARFAVGLGCSRDRRWIVISLGSRTTSECWLLDADAPRSAPRVVAPRVDGVEYDVEPGPDGLLIVHNRHHPDADLAFAPYSASSPDQWRPILDSQPGERFLGVDSFADFAVLSLRRDGVTALRVLPRAPHGGYLPGELVAFEDDLHTVALGENPESQSTVVQVVHESFVSPRAVYDLDLRTGGLTLVKRQNVLGGFDSRDYVQRRLWAPAADGTAVPISLVARAGTLPDGSHPGWLTGYGAYEISYDPYFSVARLSLLDRGVVYAVAHVRGGGELGRSWYEAGRLANKPTSFSDFVACADFLAASGWCAPDRIAADGGSAGGLLVGAAVNLAPHRFRVVHADVPFVDALTTILDPSLPLTVGEWEEWGNPVEDATIYAVMRGYTPYENISAQPYPAILATSSLEDIRVFVTEPMKWVARLRATITSDPEAAPVLLRTELSAGHGGRSGRYAAWEQTAWEWAFVLDQLGAGQLGEEVLRH